HLLETRTGGSLAASLNPLHNGSGLRPDALLNQGQCLAVLPEFVLAIAVALLNQRERSNHHLLLLSREVKGTFPTHCSPAPRHLLGLVVFAVVGTHFEEVKIGR